MFSQGNFYRILVTDKKTNKSAWVTLPKSQVSGGAQHVNREAQNLLDRGAIKIDALQEGDYGNFPPPLPGDEKAFQEARAREKAAIEEYTKKYPEPLPTPPKVAEPVQPPPGILPINHKAAADAYVEQKRQQELKGAHDLAEQARSNAEKSKVYEAQFQNISQPEAVQAPPGPVPVIPNAPPPLPAIPPAYQPPGPGEEYKENAERAKQQQAEYAARQAQGAAAPQAAPQPAAPQVPFEQQPQYQQFFQRFQPVYRGPFEGFQSGMHAPVDPGAAYKEKFNSFIYGAPQFRPPVQGQAARFAKGGSVHESHGSSHMSPAELAALLEQSQMQQMGMEDPGMMQMASGYNAGDEVEIPVSPERRSIRNAISQGAERAKMIAEESRNMNKDSNRALGRGLLNFGKHYSQAWQQPNQNAFGAFAQALVPASEAYANEAQAEEERNVQSILAQMAYQQKVQEAQKKEEYQQQKLAMEKMFKEKRLGIEGGRLSESVRHHKELENKSPRNNEATEKRLLDKEERQKQQYRLGIEKAIKTNVKDRVEELPYGKRKDPAIRKAIEAEERASFAPYLEGIDSAPTTGQQLQSYNADLDAEAQSLLAERDALLKKHAGK